MADFSSQFGYFLFFFTITLFHCLNFIVGRCGIPQSAEKDPWTWRNLIVSAFHGLLAGVWGCTCILWYPDLLKDPGRVEDFPVYAMVVFCSGYFVYDFTDYLMNGKSFTHWEVTLHHIACIFIFWHNWHTRTFVGHSLIALLTEGNSLFLHGRKLLRISKFDSKSKTYLICVVLNFVSFIIFRIAPITLVFHGCYIEYFRYPDVNLVFVTGLCTLVVAVINAVLFWRLVKTDIIRPYHKLQKSGIVICNGSDVHEKND